MAKGVRLYRGITPGALGIDVHGRYGETWTRDYDYAKRYARPPDGYVLEAILHPSARRLVLVTEVNADGFSEYVEAGIQELARIVGDPSLCEHFLRWGGLLWESWEPEWTEAIKAAGYDTIVTGGFDGPEEYVLKANVLICPSRHKMIEHQKAKDLRAVRLDREHLKRNI